MKQFTQMTYLILLLFFFISSCQKDTVKPNIESSEYFPNKVGNYWEYVVYDSIEARGTPYSNYSRNYTVKINITGIKKLVDGINATVWEYEYPWGFDTNYVRITQDTVKVYDKFRTETIYNLKFPLKIFLIPFQEGQRWDGKLIAIDSSNVKAKPSISTSAKEFKNGFSIYHHYIGPNLEYNDTYDFIPKIGMVKVYYNHYDFATPTRVLWQLKKYYLQ
jgi:hypothetical protein